MFEPMNINSLLHNLAVHVALISVKWPVFLLTFLATIPLHAAAGALFEAAAKGALRESTWPAATLKF